MPYDRIQGEILAAFEKRCKKCVPISGDSALELEAEIRKYFCDSGKSGGQLWESIRVAEEQFLGGENQPLLEALSIENESIRVLIDDWKGYSAIEVGSSSDFAIILSDFYNFKWYALTSNGSKLICRNDHDYMIISLKAL
ncbi:MAG: hypothetical protein H0W78_12190 [Planctomycetes bacterium]|nr:hypothetical protein [Planctomycetota bacterium]